MRIPVIIIVFCLMTNSVFSQYDSTAFNRAEKCSFLRRQALPIGMITTGALLNIGEIKQKIQDEMPDTHVTVDNYLLYIPMVQIYISDFAGVKAKNNWFDQTKYLATSQLAAEVIIEVLKHSFNVERPDGDDYSFPSGHTTRAFVGATALYHEFRESSPLLAYSGYVFATATGILRMTNDRHWLPDVMTGAGIAILTTNVVYYLEPFKNIQLHRKNQEISVVPCVGYKSFALVCSF